MFTMLKGINMRILRQLLVLLLIPALAYALDPNAKQITTNTGNFNHALNLTDTTVQKALDHLDDINTTSVQEGTNLYYTNTRARTAISSSATGLAYNNTTGDFSSASGYGIPTTAKQTNWDEAYTKRVNTWSNPLGFSGNTASLNYADPLSLDGSNRLYIAPAGIKDSHIDWGTGANQINTGDLTEGSNLYFTDSRARTALSNTATGLTYSNTTGVTSLTSGYGIPSTTDINNWNDANTKKVTTWPSSLSFAGNTLNVASGYVIPTTTEETNWNSVFSGKTNYDTAYTQRGYVGTKNVSETAIGNNKILKYNSGTGQLEYVDIPNSAIWGLISGNLTEQSDLSTVLNNKIAYNFSSNVSGTGDFTTTGTGSFSSLTGTGSAKSSLTAGVTVNNAAGNSANDIFQAKGYTDPNLIYTDVANDRVGIGTSSPASKFTVIGEGRFTQLVSTGGNERVTGNTYGTYIDFKTDGANIITLGGTSTPSFYVNLVGTNPQLSSSSGTIALGSNNLSGVGSVTSIGTFQNTGALTNIGALTANSATIGLNGSGGVEGSIIFRDGANPGSTETLTYTKWNFLNDANGLIKNDGSGGFTAITNSAGLAGALSDETGTGYAVFANTPTLVTPNIGVASATSLTMSGYTLDLGEWSNLDGQDQTVKVASTPRFARLGLGQAADAGAKMIAAGQYGTAQYTDTVTTGTWTTDWNNGNVHYVVLDNGSNTVTLFNPIGGFRYMLILKQPASGAAGTVTWPATVSWSYGTAPTLTSTNGKVDVITLVYDSTNNKYYAGSNLNF